MFKNITVKFVEKAVSSNFRLVLDDEKNKGVSVFFPGETAYIKLYPAGLNPTVVTSTGTITVEASMIPEVVEQELVFARSKECELRSEQVKIQQYQWLGRQGPVPLFQKNKVLLNEQFSGILYVRYLTYYDRLALKSNIEAKILVEAYTKDRYGYIEVNYRQSKAIDVNLILKDACSKQPVSGVKIWLEDKFVGLTDEDGRIYLGKLKPGRYKIRTEKQGYMSNIEDMLENEIIVVE